MALRFWPPAKSTPPRAASMKPIIQLSRATTVDRTPLSRASSPSSTTARIRAPSGGAEQQEAQPERHRGGDDDHERCGRR